MPSNVLIEPKPTSKLSKSSTTSRKFRLFKNHSRRKRPRSVETIKHPSNEHDQDLKRHLRLRITIAQARHIAPDLDTFVIVRCLKHSHRTHVVRNSTEPTWSCSFDVPINSITKRKQWRRGITIILCSKDRFRSQFLGQIHLPFPATKEEATAALFYDDVYNTSNWRPVHPTQNQQRKLSLSSTPRRRAFSESLGSEINVKTGLILEGFENDHSQVKNQRIKQVWRKLTQHHHNQPSSNMTSSAPTTPAVRSASSLPPEYGGYISKSSSSGTNTPSDYFSRQRHSRQASTDAFLSSAVSTPQTMSDSSSRKRLTARRKKKHGIEGKFHQDVMGVTFLEVCHAKDLPPERNLARTGFDMDPFVVVSYGTSTFRTSAVRHNLNPVWNEKLFFHVRHHEANFHLKFTVYDREKFSGNDLVAWCQVPIQNIIKQHKEMHFADNQEEEEEGIDMIEKEMDRLTFPLQMVNPDKWKNKRPTLTIRAKFMPYEEIRKMFWLSLAKAYDAEHTGTLSRLQVQSMLETIGSTITEATIDKFWSNNGKDPKNEAQEITLEELVNSLENYMKAEAEYNDNWSSPSLTPSASGDNMETLGLDMMRMTMKQDEDEEDEDEEDDEEDEDEEDEEDWNGIEEEEEEEEDDDQLPFGVLNPEIFDYSSMPTTPATGEQQQQQLTDVDLAEALIKEENSMMKRLPTTSNGSSMLRQHFPSHRRTAVEKVIRLKECPICHRPNLGRRSQMDIITHIATCAANDWTTVDRFLMGNFLTEAYAQRRWFVKLVRKVGYGKYSLGRDNANIIIQDRRTGQLIEEKMSVYVRLGMRLVYKGMKTSIQSKGAQRILTNLTLKQGRRFDSPNSAREIPGFIKFHKIQLHEVWKPVSSFKTFNEFFYRKLKPGARPTDSPEDPTVAVSPADSRMTAFDSVSEATRLWIKGIEFSLKKLLGDPCGAKELQGGPLAVFRLAPQDYHRFHSPVDGVVTKVKHISGQYYTVNPMAIRTTIDVFGENARTIVWMDSKQFGKVAVVCVGAMLVGSIIITAKVGSELKRADEMGYFAFGGSTLVVVFEKGKMNFDRDLLGNSDRTVETLVQVGNHIGRLPPQ
ncbi:25S rRNA (adenine645-N1)-methyltransferase [Mucor velutinosus]|uniref:Phosphatidylserine decarboxylase proenzyme 2 n=1 Tax=Mucor velutinosus TaxID=708070 RepID=A0AAN7DTR1_9FUNG|nr:25S rRNA (adenine645-N1)-methyltransferase [Mucor velutinosus]